MPPHAPTGFRPELDRHHSGSYRAPSRSEKVNVLGTSHAILGGLRPGPVDVYDAPPASTQGNDASNQVGYAVPQPSAARALGVPGVALFNGRPIPPFTEARMSLFTYEAGDTLIASDSLNLVARGRRVGFFAHSRGGENLNAAGRELFINTILWATGREGESHPISATPTARDRQPELPSTFAIASVYPNPFNPTTTALLSVRQTGAYEVRVFDVLGRLVQSRMLHVNTPGEFQVSLEMHHHASGMYLIQVVQQQTKRVATATAILLK